ncbi:alpha/beta fold hydrolase [Phytomonospora sp. NPDC050363]|uniref:alpha/beta fold hydrolase n=1 Tax=Phytomonospora sp. NPDC050363 TaxID=3155642 RepID=UPI0033E73273
MHGDGGNASLWCQQVEALAAEHPVFAVDVIDDPGRSVQREPLAGPADHARWLGEVLDGLGLHRVHFVGHASGAWLALNQASRAPERVASLTALEPVGIVVPRAAFALSGMVGFARLLTRSRRLPWPARRLANAALMIDWTVSRPILQAAVGFGPRRSKGRRCADEDLGAIRAPTQIVIGGRSTLLRPAEAVARIRRVLPDARIEVIPDAGHGLQFGYPERVNAAILAHVDGS